MDGDSIESAKAVAWAPEEQACISFECGLKCSEGNSQALSITPMLSLPTAIAHRGVGFKRLL